MTLSKRLARNESVSLRSPLANLMVLGAGIGLLYWSYQYLQTRMTSVISVDAVVNGALVELKAPEEGVIEAGAFRTGDPVVKDSPLFKLTNTRASEVKGQELVSRLREQQLELTGAKARLSQKQKMLALVSRDADQQVTLEGSEVGHQIQQFESELEGARSRLKLAELNHRRLAKLQKQGAVPAIDVDIAKSEQEQRASEVKSWENRIAAQRVNRQAVDQGLTLTRTRSNYDPTIRRQELELEIVGLQQEVVLLAQAIRNTQAEYLKVREETQKKQLAQVNAPANGVLWELAVQPGQFVQQGEPLGKMMDCDQRWIDAVVDENALGALQIGTPAQVQLHGADDIVLQGEVSMIRGGVGRLVAGQDVLTPLQRNLPRHTQVRVKLPGQATTALVSNSKVASGNLCYIGYTGRVTFQKQGEASKDLDLWSRFRSIAGRLAS